MRGTRWAGWAYALTGLLLATGPAVGVEPNTKQDGYRGIWFSIGQANDYGPKYSGGLGTYTANHVPICIYAEEVNKTFFSYGGVDLTTGDLLIMVSYFDHETCMVPRPTVVHHKVGINDPHDNGAILLDKDGYIWVFISGRARSRTGWLYRSTEPYSIDAFEWKLGGTGDNFFEKTYPQPWYMDNGVDEPVFLYMFTKYTAGRELYWSTSSDGVNWAPDQKLAGTGGHYQTSCAWKGRRVGTAFNHHPNGNVDRRTNLYYLQTDNLGATWTKADGTPVTVPLTDKHNPALLVDYEAQGRLCYINDTNFDEDGNPYIIYITSGYYAAGPDSEPRTWHLARWNGSAWIFTEITGSTTHNYDVGSLWIEGGNHLRILGPTEPGPQQWGTGGEVALWISPDRGLTWSKQRDVTRDSVYNHSYVRRPVKGRDPFFAFWADGHALQKTESRLYFCNRMGNRVWQLPYHMTTDFARPALVTDFSGGGLGASFLWRSRFESASNVPVSHGDPAGGILNAVGETGTLVSDLSPSYAAYGQPGVGAAPASSAGAFAVSLPNSRGNALRTGVASNTGNLADALTFEGFFNHAETALITSPTFIGRRLVTQGRSASAGESRLAIGIHAGTAGSGPGLYAYEGFDYEGTQLHGQAGGSGWAGPWVDATGTFAHLTDNGISLNSPVFPFDVVGSRISGQGGTAARPMNSVINLAEDGHTLYVSALMRKTATDSPFSSKNLEINLTPSTTTTQVMRMGMTSDHKFFLGTGSNNAGTVEAGVTYFLIGKVVSRAAADDEFYLNFYGPTDTLPTTEPGSWMLSATASRNDIVNHLRLVIGSTLNQGEIDEIRVGGDYASVIDPEAPPGGGTGGTANLLSFFWVDSTNTNNLRTGSTPIQPHTWYHFALVYDGSDVRWYLDGNLEGQVENADLIAPGSAPVTIANNRDSGVADRGFFGLLDEVRLMDVALEPGQFLNDGGSCPDLCAPGAAGNLLWCSSFEAEPDVPVSHNQVEAGTCGAIRNEHGAGGTAIDAVPLLYVGYGEAGVGDAPAGSAGAFALALPDNRSAGIDTLLPSNAGDLANALTFEGFFNTAEAAAITQPVPLGRRLVTQKRSALDSESRLAIGLHASGGENVLAVLWRGQDGTDHAELGQTAIQAGTWYHFAVTYDGQAIRWYLDGQLEGFVAAPDLAAPGAAPLAIGNGRVSGLADRGFYGMIDEVRISDQALKPASFLLPPTGDPDDPCLPACPRPFADADPDGDVDQSDFGIFQRCYSGPIHEGPPADPACYCFDRDGDDDVDGDDFTAFMDCVSGSAIIWSQSLTPDCNP